MRIDPCDTAVSSDAVCVAGFAADPAAGKRARVNLPERVTREQSEILKATPLLQEDIPSFLETTLIGRHLRVNQLNDRSSYSRNYHYQRGDRRRAGDRIRALAEGPQCKPDHAEYVADGGHHEYKPNSGPHFG